jgi:hypothetical protein
MRESASAYVHHVSRAPNRPVWMILLIHLVTTPPPVEPVFCQCLL